MKDAEAKHARASALLKLLEKKAQRLPSDMPEEERNGQAMAFMDRVLGPLWRKEVEKADLDLPEATANCGHTLAKDDALESMYTKVQELLNKEGLHGDTFSKRRLIGEDDPDNVVRVLIGR